MCAVIRLYGCAGSAAHCSVFRFGDVLGSDVCVLGCIVTGHEVPVECVDGTWMPCLAPARTIAPLILGISLGRSRKTSERVVIREADAHSLHDQRTRGASADNGDAQAIPRLFVLL
jgi:hypothetical protein